jgi:hypothetical protein
MSTFEVLNPYPNPCVNNVTVPILMNETGTVEVNLYTEAGQLVHDPYSISLEKGLQVFTIDITGLVKGSYVVKVVYDRESKLTRFVKY